jgi:pyrroloquinoline quinone biosynthesis protein D
MSETTLQRPQLASGVRLRWDQVRERHVLLFPEGAANLNSTAADVLQLCTGAQTLDEIVAELSARYSGADVRADVEGLLAAFSARGLVVDADA